MEENYNFIIKYLFTKCGRTPLFITFEQSFLSISTLYKVICYNFFRLDPDPPFLSCWIRIRIEKNSWIRIRNPDPQKMNADQQPWKIVSAVIQTSSLLLKINSYPVPA